MKEEQRNWVLKAIDNCFESVVFQHQQERLQMMKAKYSDEDNEITQEELKEDMTYLDNIYG